MVAVVSAAKTVFCTTTIAGLAVTVAKETTSAAVVGGTMTTCTTPSSTTTEAFAASPAVTGTAITGLEGSGTKGHGTEVTGTKGHGTEVSGTKSTISGSFGSEVTGSESSGSKVTIYSQGSSTAEVSAAGVSAAGVSAASKASSTTGSVKASSIEAELATIKQNQPKDYAYMVERALALAKYTRSDIVAATRDYLYEITALKHIPMTEAEIELKLKEIMRSMDLIFAENGKSFATTGDLYKKKYWDEVGV